MSFNDGLIVRAVGYALCAGLFLLAAVWIPRERWFLLSIALFWFAGLLAVLVRRFDGLALYLQFLDIVLTPLVYLIAAVTAVYLLRRFNHHRD